MKKFIAVLLLLFSMAAPSATAQSHIGPYTQLVLPISPLSKGYKTGFGAGLMYRHFYMGDVFFWDIAMGYQRIPAKSNPDYPVPNPSFINYGNNKDLNYFPMRMGFAWSFLPNGSPNTQPFAGIDFVYTAAGAAAGGSLLGGAPRLGWMIYAKETVMISLEMRYNLQFQLGSRENDQYTKINSLIDHQLVLDLSVAFSVFNYRGTLAK